MMDNFEQFSTNKTTCSSSKMDNSLDKSKRDLTSPHEPLAMNRNLTNCLLDPYSWPSAIFVEIDTTARSIWFLTEKTFTSHYNWNTSFASTTASCQTKRSSNLSLFFISKYLNDLIYGIFSILNPTLTSSILPVSPASPFLPQLS